MKLLPVVALAMLAGSCQQYQEEEGPRALGAEITESAMVFRVSGDLFRKAMQKELEEPVEVGRWMDGVWIYGQGSSKAQTDFEPTAHSDQAVLTTVTSTAVNTRTFGSQSRVQFRFDNLVNITSKTSLMISADRGLWLEQTQSTGAADVRLTCIDSNRLLFSRLAIRRATREIYGRLPRTRQQLVTIAADEANVRIDQEAQAYLQDPMVLQLDEMRQKMLAAGYGDRLKFSTSDRHIFMSLGKRTAIEAPRSLPDSGVTVAMHDSVLNEQFAAAFSSSEMTQQEFDQGFKKIIGRFVATNSSIEDTSSSESDPDDPSAITFADRAPIVFETSENQVILTIRGDSWTTPNNTYEKKMDVIATYKKVQTEAGVRLMREPNLKVIPRGWQPDDGALSLRDQIIAGALKRQFKEKIQHQMVEPELDLDGQAEKVGVLALSHVETTASGWLILGYDSPQ